MKIISNISIEDDLTALSVQMQTSSPQPTYSINAQNSSFVATHMYGTENSNFGPIYHHHHHHNTHPYAGNPYKVPTAATTPNVYGSYQGFYGHQMARVDYIPR